MKKILCFSLSFIIVGISSAFACTSMIISSAATASGKPVMLKNRDTGQLNNRMEYFHGQKYDFIGLVNSPSEGGEVWAGTNSAGFCIMNTASYNIKNDDIPDSRMDNEGVIMFEALGVCSSVDDFELFLKNHSKPLGVEANFGVIDAFGGAAYYEANNFEWVKYDVNDRKTAPDGYMVVTNFSEWGRYEDYSGWERYLTACDAMKRATLDPEGKLDVDHSFIFRNFSRSYRHSLLGLDYDDDSNLPASGVAVDQDFIPRKSTSASVVFEGVSPGTDPQYTVMWTMIGYPACSISVPLLVSDGDCLPDYIKKGDDSDNCSICDISLKVKNERIFNFKISNGNKYFRITEAKKLSRRIEAIETAHDSEFYDFLAGYQSSAISKHEFFESYVNLLTAYYRDYLALFTEND